MTDRKTQVSRRSAAIVAGLALLVMAVLAIVANPANLIVPGDAAGSARNVAANELLFRVSVASFVIVAVLDVVVAWALYLFLRPVNKDLSLLTAWFRLAYAVILWTALASLLGVLLLSFGDSYTAAFGTEQLQALTLLFLSAFSFGWNVGLVFFGLHLLVLGYLVFRLDYPGYVPRILGILLVIASLGYLIDGFGLLLLANYNVSIVLFTFFGELLLMLWLLWGGARGFGGQLEA
jgi:hypothetical protein